MSDKLRFEAIGLDYGCHHGRYRFSGGDGPTVIVGSNGTGKSTLVEAIVRTLFGFNRQRRDARRQQEQRRPWKGGRFRAGLTMRDRGGALSFERDFDSNEVVVVRLGDALLEDGVRGTSLPVEDAEAGSRGVIRGPGTVRPETPPPGIDLIELHTGEDYLPAVRAMLERREKRRAH